LRSPTGKSFTYYNEEKGKNAESSIKNINQNGDKIQSRLNKPNDILKRSQAGNLLAQSQNGFGRSFLKLHDFRLQ